MQERGRTPGHTHSQAMHWPLHLQAGWQDSVKGGAVLVAIGPSRILARKRPSALGWLLPCNFGQRIHGGPTTPSAENGLDGVASSLLVDLCRQCTRIPTNRHPMWPDDGQFSSPYQLRFALELLNVNAIRSEPARSLPRSLFRSNGRLEAQTTGMHDGNQTSPQCNSSFAQRFLGLERCSLCVFLQVESFAVRC